VPGQLVISFPRSWGNPELRAVCERLGARYMESMEEKQKRSALPVRPDFPYSMHLVEVRRGGSTDYTKVLDHLRKSADSGFLWHTSPEYGRGVIHV
jgi:hypothetical protein